MLHKLLETPGTEPNEFSISDLTAVGRKLDRFHRLASMVAGMEMQEAAKKGVKPAELLALKAGQISEIDSQRLAELIGQLGPHPAATP